MSVSAEAAYFAPPEGRPFNFKEALRASRRLLLKRVLPNLRDDTVYYYKKAAAFGVWCTSLGFYAEQTCGTAFDDDDAILSEMKAEQKERSERARKHWASHYIGRPAAALAFLAVVAGPGGISTRTNPDGEREAIAAFTESEASQRVEQPTYPIMYSPEWHRNRARLMRAYEARRAEQNPPVEVTLDVSPAKTQIGPLNVVTMVPEDEYGYRDY